MTSKEPIMPNHWLLKSEPSTFSIEDLEKRPKKTEPWNGVRNYQARNFMRDSMQIHDLALFYHSSCPTPGIVGLVEVTSKAYPDYTSWEHNSEYYDPKSTPENPRWFMVDVRLKRKLRRLITLQEIKQHPLLVNMLINRPGNRLSITPVTEIEWQAILEME